MNDIESPVGIGRWANRVIDLVVGTKVIGIRLDQYLASLEEFGIRKPWYWDQFLVALETYHHMVYVSAYTYRASVWFDFVFSHVVKRFWLTEKNYSYFVATRQWLFPLDVAPQRGENPFPLPQR